MFLYYPEIYYNKIKVSLFGNRLSRLKEEDYSKILSELISKEKKFINKDNSINFYIGNCFIKEYNHPIIQSNDNNLTICKNHISNLLELKLSLNYALSKSKELTEYTDCSSLQKCYFIYKNDINKIFMEEAVMRCSIEEEFKYINSQTTNKVKNINSFIQKQKNKQPQQLKDFKEIRSALNIKYNMCLNSKVDL